MSIKPALILNNLLSSLAITEAKTLHMTLGTEKLIITSDDKSVDISVLTPGGVIFSKAEDTGMYALQTGNWDVTVQDGALIDVLPGATTADPVVAAEANKPAPARKTGTSTQAASPFRRAD